MRAALFVAFAACYGPPRIVYRDRVVIHYIHDPTPCLTLAPPEKPDVTCGDDLSRDDCNDIMTARKLDYLERLARWTDAYAWPVCRDYR